MPEKFYPTIRARLESDHPDLWRAFYPRTYNGVDGWGSCAVLAAHMSACCLAYGGGLADDPYTRITVGTAARLLEHDVPLFWVKRELLDAVARTEPPEDLLWTEMKFPYPAGVFMLPAGTICDGSGYRYDYVTWCVIKGGQEYLVPGAGSPLAWANDALIFASASADDPDFGGLTRSVSANKWPWAHLPVGQHEDGLISNLDASQDETVNRLARLALGLLLVMDARPAVLSKGAPRLARPKPAKREIWTPNVLGATYRAPSGTHGESSHASPRMHWRRGHFRRQAFGAQRAERKTIWIEPTLIGKENL